MMITPEQIDRIIENTSANEGKPGEVNPNNEGTEGISWDILQWTQRSGEVGVLLRMMQATAPGLFAEVFGPAWSELLTVTNARTDSERLKPVAGVVLWKEPWLSRFQAAGRQPTFQKVARLRAGTGPHMIAALDCAKMLNCWTERALALFFDTAVQQGPTGARTVAQRTLDALVTPGSTAQLSVSVLLQEYAMQAPWKFRATAPPSSSKFTWRRVGDAWHAFSGSVDLYENIRKRRFAILNSTSLADSRVRTVA
jgi:hypothetical protein